MSIVFNFCFRSYANYIDIIFSKQVEVSEQGRPLYSVNSIAMDKEGRVYYELPSFGAVQVYDKNGEVIESITPKGALFPLPIIFYWVVFAFGIIGFIVFMPGMRQVYRILIWVPSKKSKK